MSDTLTHPPLPVVAADDSTPNGLILLTLLLFVLLWLLFTTGLAALFIKRRQATVNRRVAAPLEPKWGEKQTNSLFILRYSLTGDNFSTEQRTDNLSQRLQRAEASIAAKTHYHFLPAEKDTSSFALRPTFTDQMTLVYRICHPIAMLFFCSASVSPSSFLSLCFRPSLSLSLSARVSRSAIHLCGPEIRLIARLCSKNNNFIQEIFLYANKFARCQN